VQAGHWRGKSLEAARRRRRKLQGRYRIAAKSVKTRAATALRELRGGQTGVICVAMGCAHRSRSSALFREGQTMKVDEATVRHVARLARIKVSAVEAKSLQSELSAILDWVEQLDEVDTANTEPMTRIEGLALPRRADVVTDGGIADQIVQNAPLTEDHFFLVPKVVE
jgi:aspartyl-tRNA(Asn)/glutamyl-tRNA(Gln) amidotransferase subunit C